MRRTRLLEYAAAIAMAVLMVVLMAGPVDRTFAQSPASTNTSTANKLGTNISSYSYLLEEGWAKLPPGRKWGAVSGVDIDRDGKSVWVLDRCETADDCSGSSVAPIMKFDSTGKLVASFGAGMFAYPHGIFVDADNNIWVTDGRAKNGKGQTVVKFSQDGKMLMTLGPPGGAGDGQGSVNGLADGLVAPDGDIF